MQMRILHEAWEKDPLTYLLEAKFPGCTKPAPLTPFRGQQHKTEERAALEMRVAAYREELEKLPYNELKELAATKAKTRRELERARQEAEEKSRFFNQPRAMADYSYWVKMSYWRLNDAVALSLGRDPKIAAWDKVESYTKVSPFAEEYEKRREIILRASHMKQLSDFMPPHVFLAWAQRMQIESPLGLLNAFNSLGIQVADWKTLYDSEKRVTEAYKEHVAALEADIKALKELPRETAKAKTEKPLNLKERDSMLKLIVGMAIGGYGHDPKALRSSTASEIADDLIRNGLEMDKDTIRKYLNQGREFLPPSDTN